MIIDRPASDTAGMHSKITRREARAALQRGPQVALLRSLSVLFVLRVVAQFVQYLFAVDALPAFEQWQSGALPYPVLFVFQVAIVAAQVVVVRAAARGRSLVPERCHRALRFAALAYLAVMVVRLLAGLTFAAGNGWLDARIPTVFHLVLACFLLLWLRLETADRSARGADASDDRAQRVDQVVRRDLDLEPALSATDEDGVVVEAAFVDRGRQ
jgi:hypothetical protein